MIRAEAAADVDAIRKVVKSAFREPTEATLVDRIRVDCDGVISLVATEAGVIVGHVLFSRMGAPFRALGLGPVSVMPAHQRAVIGSALIREGLEQAKAAGWEGVFVVGEPSYYRRFGFTTECASGFAFPYAGPHFMGFALKADDLPSRSGIVAYPPSFAALGC